MKTLVALENQLGPASAAAQATTSALLTQPVRMLGRRLRRSRGRGEMEANFDPGKVRSILLTRVDGLGDLVLFSPLLREIRNLWPQAHITLVVDTRFASFVEQCPYVDEVFGFNLRGSKFTRLLQGPRRAYQLAKEKLWDRKFDLAISPRWDVDSRHAAVLGYLSLPTYHFGFSEQVSQRKRNINRGLNSLFSHIIASKAGVRHEIERNAEVLSALGGNPMRVKKLEVWLSDSDRAYARQVLAKNNMLSRQPLICLGIGATEAKRRWPIERFAALSEWLVAQYDAKILVVGDSVDACSAEQMRPILGMSMINEAGVCTVRQSAALISFCDLFIGNDSGPMHLAAAADIPVMELSCHPITAPEGHINSPHRYAPLTRWLRVVQPTPRSEECESGCNDAGAHCIVNIHLHDVKELVTELMSEQPMERRSVATAGD